MKNSFYLLFEKYKEMLYYNIWKNTISLEEHFILTKIKYVGLHVL